MGSLPDATVGSNEVAQQVMAAHASAYSRAIAANAQIVVRIEKHSADYRD
jgi:hypothetical protein